MTANTDGPVGLKHVADFEQRRPGRGPMRFFRGVNEIRPHHHDIALVEMLDVPAATVSAIGHIALVLADRESWLRQVGYLGSRGIACQRAEHGISHSVCFDDPDGNRIEPLYESQRALREYDIGAALNHVVAYSDDTATLPFIHGLAAPSV